MSAAPPLLSGLLRPTQLDELTLPQGTIRSLRGMIASGQIMNMTFHGRPGIGKTSAARIIIQALGANDYEINGSSCAGIDYVRKTIIPFAYSLSLIRGQKICFIDEADYLSGHAQAALRHVIEETSENCRFLFTANELRKLTPAIQSRMMAIRFDIADCERAEIINRKEAWYATKLTTLGITVDPKRLKEIVAHFFPDFREFAPWRRMMPRRARLRPIGSRPSRSSSLSVMKSKRAA